jgi:transposase-like protein
MRADVRRRIEEALAQSRLEEVRFPSEDINQAVQEAMSGEREFSIEEIASKHGLTYHTVYRAVKGKPGYRVYGKRRGAKVSASLYRSFLADAIKRGLAAA